MADKFIHLTNDDTQCYPFFRLQLVVVTFGHSSWWTNQSNSLESPKLLNQRIRKHYKRTLGTCVLNNPLSTLSLSLWLKCLSIWNNYINRNYNFLKIFFSWKIGSVHSVELIQIKYVFVCLFVCVCVCVCVCKMEYGKESEINLKSMKVGTA